MASENQELLARISQLAGQINRHKNQQAGITSMPSSQHAANGHRVPPSSSYTPHHRPPHTSTYPVRGGSLRGRGGGYRVKKPAPYRNRTLVLSGNAPASGDQADGESVVNSDSGPSKSSWVSRTGRHMQLINSEVYEKDAQARTMAIEQTRLQRQKQRDDRERAKLWNHLGHQANGQRVAAAASFKGGAGGVLPSYQVVVQGIPFTVAKNGSKLIKVPGDPNPPSSTPKMAIVGGVKFYRSKNGNLYRHAVVKAQQRAGTVKIDEPCKIFSTTGSCSKGPRCRYIHDPTKVAVCKDFLLKGDCPSGGDCDLSHDLTPERTPFCVHYAKGNCTNPKCPYIHSQVSRSSGALVCRPFGYFGYCDRGADCTERHVLFECPDFTNTGVCKIKGCKLPHRERASFLRRANPHSGITSGIDTDTGDADADEADLVDVSSDEDSVNSDDVDSDEVDEFVAADSDDADLDFVTQKDYIEI